MMNKKFFTRLLCMVLVAMLPLMAFAETTKDNQATYTFTATPGEALTEQIPALADLLNVLSLQVYGIGEKTAGMSVLLSGEETLSFALRAEEDGLYIESKQLYEKPIYVAFEQLQTLLNSTAGQHGMSSTMIEQSMQIFAGSAVYEKNFEIPESITPSESFEETMKNFKDPEFREYYSNMTGGDDSFLNWMESIVNRMVVTEGEFKGEDHDPANYQMDVVITQADYVAMCDTTYMKNQLKSQVIAANGQLSDEELEQKLDETIKEVKKTFEDMDLQMPMTILYDGNKLVSLSMSMTAENKATTEDSEITNMAMAMDYRRLTTDGNTAHRFAMNASADQEPAVFALNGVVNHLADGSYNLDMTLDNEGKAVFSAKGVYTEKDDKVDALLSLLPEGEDEILVQIDRAKVKGGSENHLSFYTRTAGADRLTLTESDKPMITFNVVTNHGTPDGRLDEILAATKDSAVDALSLSTQDLNTLASDLITNAMKLQSSFFSKLPSSVLMLLLGTHTNTTTAE